MYKFVTQIKYFLCSKEAVRNINNNFMNGANYTKNKKMIIYLFERITLGE